jgi:ABC-type transporter Mla MlaB component
MQDTPHSMDGNESEEKGPGGAEGPPATDDAALDPAEASTVIVEVLPGVALVAGEVPPELKLDLIDFGIVPEPDRKQLSTILAAIGNVAGVAGDLGNAFAGLQGLYRIDSASLALLKSGATLAVKDGGNLGTVMVPGNIVRQARFYRVDAVSKAQTAASIGPALAMVALQMMLSEVTALVRTNLALTSQVLADLRKEQWAELKGLVAVIDRAVEQAREIGSVPGSLWDDIAGSGTLLQKQLELYQPKVRDHIAKISGANPGAHREYLQANAEAIAFDAHALLSSLKAWTGYHALRAAKARAAGRQDTAEARYAEVIARTTRAEFEPSLTEATRLIDRLTRELRIIAELPGSDAWPLPGKRKDQKAAREIAARLLEAVEPLADALHPPVPALTVPDVVCAPETLELKPYLSILRWFFEDGETLRVLGFPEPLDDPGILGGAVGILAAVMDKQSAGTLVAVTDRRILTARTNAFLERGELHDDTPLDRVRYVRVTPAKDSDARTALDVITAERNVRWQFREGIDTAEVEALGAVLAESMTIPDSEREALRRRGRGRALEPGEDNVPVDAGGTANETVAENAEPGD